MDPGLQELIEQKENYLKELAMSLSSYIQELNEKDEKIALLEQKTQVKSKKLKTKEVQLEQEIKDKEIIFARIRGLEELMNPINISKWPKRSKNKGKDKTDTISNYLDFYNKLNSGITRDSVPELSENLEEESKEVFEIEMGNTNNNPNPIISDEVDISKELEALGLGDLVKKYK